MTVFPEQPDLPCVPSIPGPRVIKNKTSKIKTLTIGETYQLLLNYSQGSLEVVRFASLLETQGNFFFYTEDTESLEYVRKRSLECISILGEFSPLFRTGYVDMEQKEN